MDEVLGIASFLSVGGRLISEDLQNYQSNTVASYEIEYLSVKYTHTHTSPFNMSLKLKVE